MIVISGLLVILALALLICGLIFTDDLLLMYVSIAISLVAGVFLLIAIFQRTDEELSEAAGPPLSPALAPGEGTTGPAPSGPPVAAPLPPAGHDPSIGGATTEVDCKQGDPEDAAAHPSGLNDGGLNDGGEVGGAAYVAPFLRLLRYHVAACPLLADHEGLHALDVAAAKSAGFIACEVCEPDLVVAAEAAAAADQHADELDGGPIGTGAIRTGAIGTVIAGTGAIGTGADPEEQYAEDAG